MKLEKDLHDLLIDELMVVLLTASAIEFMVVSIVLLGFGHQATAYVSELIAISILVIALGNIRNGWARGFFKKVRIYDSESKSIQDKREEVWPENTQTLAEMRKESAD